MDLSNLMIRKFNTYRPLTNYEHMLIIKLSGGISNGKAEKLQAG